MAGKCEDCNIPYIQYRATCQKDENGVYQTKRYYRCHKCGTIYVEVDAPQDENHIPGVIRVEKYPPVKKEDPVKKEETRLDKWM